MTVLVTGSTGFLGTAVVERLLVRDVARIRCLARPSSDTSRLQALADEHGSHRLELMIGNLQSLADAQRALTGVDTICHLASAMRGPPAQIFFDTVVASSRLLDAIATSTARRFVLVSSLGVYGLADVPAERLITEAAALEPHPERRDPYSYAKLRQERLVQDHAARLGLDLVILRPGSLYGRGGPAFSPRVGLAVAGWLLQFGGRNVLPLCHVSNCAEAVVLAATASGFERGAYTMALSKWAERWHVCSRGRIPRFLTPYRAANAWGGHRFDNRKLRAAGWTGVISTADGLAEAFADLRARQGASARGETPMTAATRRHLSASVSDARSTRRRWAETSH
jgi:nucleoside-diphosphate-sugar epimerase